MTRDLPSFLQDLLAAPPRAGEGVHGWLYCVARHLHAHLPAGEIVTMLEDRVRGCGRHVSRSEIEDAVKNSIPCAWQPKGNAASVQSAKWPVVNQEQREAVIRDNGGLADLWELSRPRIEDNDAHTEDIRGLPETRNTKTYSLCYEVRSGITCFHENVQTIYWTSGRRLV